MKEDVLRRSRYRTEWNLSKSTIVAAIEDWVSNPDQPFSVIEERYRLSNQSLGSLIEKHWIGKRIIYDDSVIITKQSSINQPIERSLNQPHKKSA